MRLKRVETKRINKPHHLSSLSVNTVNTSSVSFPSPSCFVFMEVLGLNKCRCKSLAIAMQWHLVAVSPHREHQSWGAWGAQLVKCQGPDLRVVGSSPVGRVAY